MLANDQTFQVDLEDLQLTLIEANKLFDERLKIPNRAGVYVIGIRAASPVITETDYPHPCIQIGRTEYAIAYVGETWAIKNRLLDHLVGDCRASNFRHSILALRAAGSISIGPVSEAALSEHLLAEAIVGFCEPEFIGPAERSLIDKLQPAFNIRGCRDAGWKKVLQAARKNFSAAKARQDVA